MKVKYISDDGKEFSTEDECLSYEKDKALKAYHERWINPHLDVRANKVIYLFQSACRKHRESDDYLESQGSNPRYANLENQILNIDVGTIHLRDDLVDILIMRIRELEGRPVYIANKA